MTDMKTILLIDDNDADNAYHEIILRRHPGVHEVVARESASDGIQYLRSIVGAWPDMVFVDLNMPGMDGVECIEQLVRLKIPVHTRIFLLTSSDAEQDRNRAGQLSLISDYIIKPLTPEIISRLLSV